MARLPDSSSLGQRPTPRPDTSVVDRSSGHVGEAMSRIGQAITEFSQEVEKKNDAQAVFDARRQLDDWERSTLYDQKDGVISKKGADALNLPQKVTKDYDTFASQLSDGLTSNRQREVFRDVAQARRNQVADFTLRHAVQQKEVYEKGQLEADMHSSEDRTKTLTLNGDFVGAFMEQGVAAARLGGFLKDRGASEQEVSQAIADNTKKTRESAYYAYFETQATNAFVNGDAKTLGEMKTKLDSQLGENVDPLKRAALSRQFHAWQESIVSTDRYRVASKVQDYKSAVLNGEGDRIPLNMVPTQDEVKALHPKGDDAAIYYRNEVEPYIKIQAGVQALKDASYDDRKKMVESAKPEEVAPGYEGAMGARDALVKANKLVDQKIYDNPATYVLQNSPAVKKWYDAMQTVLSLPEGNPNATPEDRAAVVKAYADRMNAEQLRLGVTQIRDEKTGNKNKTPRLLPNEMANSIADQFSDQRTGGAKSAELIRSLESTWGPAWPQVYKQLATDTKLPPAALVIPNMPDDASRSLLAQASQMKPDELKALVAPSDPKDIREKLLDKFKDAQSTFMAQGGSGAKTLTTVIDEAEKLATIYRGKGDSISTAAEKAYNRTMGWKYLYTDTYRVPQDKGVMPISDIRRGSQMALDSMVKAGGLKVFSDNSATPRIVDDAIKSRSVWVTNDDETGLQLMLQGQDGSMLAAQKEGHPVMVDWATLMTNAKTPAASLGNTPELRQQQGNTLGFGAEMRAADKARGK